MTSKIALFDICGTLFHANTTFDFLDFYTKKRSYRLFRLLMRSTLWRYFNSLAYRLFAVDLSRRVALSYLKGYTRGELRGMARFFYDNYLESRKIKQVWRILMDCQMQKFEIVLISGTIDPIAEVVAQKLCVEKFVSSSLLYDAADVCCGKLAHDALRAKSTMLHSLDVQPPYELLVTDNPGDLSMVGEAKNSVLVAHNNENRWKYLTRRFKNVRILQCD